MNNPYLSTVNWTAMSMVTGLVIGLVVTGVVTGLLYKAFPKFRRPQVSFWVMLGLLLVISIGSMVILTPLQVHNQASGGIKKGGGTPPLHGPAGMP